ncbi:MAG: Gx transporter family protein [Clostridia bacterium]|nr:Gx transporter family protein [Clostridia bacterium]
MNYSVKKIVFTAVLASLALIAFMIESLFPPILVPGAKLGLSNFFILTVLIFLGVKEAIAVFLIKIILGSVFSGNISALLYSFPSGTVSLLVEILLFTKIKTSVLSASALGAVINNAVQLSVYVLITNTIELYVYLPYLLLIGLLAGAFNGFLCVLISKALLKTKNFQRLVE